MDRLATNLPMFEGRRERKKGEKGKGTREREGEGVSQPPTPCFASTRKRYRRALPMKVMVNNAATELTMERERESMVFFFFIVS